MACGAERTLDVMLQEAAESAMFRKRLHGSGGAPVALAFDRNLSARFGGHGDRCLGHGGVAQRAPVRRVRFIVRLV